MKDKYGYIIVSIVLFVEILALMIFISCGGDMNIKKILYFLLLNVAILAGLFGILYVANIAINWIYGNTGEIVYLSKENLSYKSNFKSAREIYIAKDVTNIPYKHFSNLDEYLQYVVFEGENTVIGENAFEKCKNLERVYLPKKLQEIKDETFENCKNLKSVTIPDSVIEIGIESFAGCSSLTSVKIGNGVEEIGVGAFQDCKKLKSVTIPDNVTKIGAGAFAGCRNQIVVNYRGSKEEWKKIDIGLGNKSLKVKNYNYEGN